MESNNEEPAADTTARAATDLGNTLSDNVPVTPTTDLGNTLQIPSGNQRPELRKRKNAGKKGEIPISTYIAEDGSQRFDEEEETLLGVQLSDDDSNPSRVRLLWDWLRARTEIRSGSLADEDKEARKSLIRLVDPMMYFCGAAALGGISMNATMKQTSDDKHISGLSIVTLCLLLNFVVFALIRLTLHYSRQKEITYALDKLVLLPVVVLMVLLSIALGKVW